MWSHNTPHSVVWRVCGWNQLKWWCNYGILQSFVHARVETAKMVREFIFPAHYKECSLVPNLISVVTMCGQYMKIRLAKSGIQALYKSKKTLQKLLLHFLIRHQTYSLLMPTISDKAMIITQIQFLSQKNTNPITAFLVVYQCKEITP